LLVLARGEPRPNPAVPATTTGAGLSLIRGCQRPPTREAWRARSSVLCDAEGVADMMCYDV
jgi:hypothetical protein